MAKSPIVDIYNSNAKLIFLTNYTPINLNYIDEQSIFQRKNRELMSNDYYFKEIDKFKIPLFPIILQSNKERWLLSDLYFHYLIENNTFSNFKTLISIANHLLHFLRFIEHRDLKITYSPREKYKRVTYQFLNELEFLIRDDFLTVNTATHRLIAMINFYETCINNRSLAKVIIASLSGLRVQQLS